MSVSRTAELRRLRRIMVACAVALTGLIGFGFYESGKDFWRVLGLLLFGFAFMLALQFGGGAILRRMGYRDTKHVSAEDLATYIFCGIILAALAIQKLT